MPTIQVEAEVSTRDLLRAVAQLSPAELEQFVTEVLALRAQRTSSGTPEPELLQRLRQVLPDEVRQRYRALIAKRRDRTLTAEEQAELLRLTDEVEKADAERVRVLGQIAQRRNQSLTDVMQDLGIQAPPYE
jgi:hypothetical protein